MNNRLSSHIYVLEAFYDRISLLIEMYNDGSGGINIKQLQKSTDREVSRLKIVNAGVIPQDIKDLIELSDLKY